METSVLFRIKDGHVDFKQRYVRTEKFVKEAEARRALLGPFSWPSRDLLAIAVYLLFANREISEQVHGRHSVRRPLDRKHQHCLFPGYAPCL